MNWEQIVEDLGPKLYRYFSFLLNDNEADDLTQETLIRLVRKVSEGKFDSEKGNLRMLAFGIAHFVFLENRKITQFESIDDFNFTDDKDSFDEILISHEEVGNVRENLKYLSTIEQTVLSLCIDDDMSLVDISSILMIPVGTVKNHVFRAKQKLIRRLQNER